MSTGKRIMWERFSAWLIMEPTTPKQAKAYRDLMMVAYVVVFSTALADMPKAVIIACWTTGCVDLWLFLNNEVRYKFPLSIPLGLVAMLGLLLNHLVVLVLI